MLPLPSPPSRQQSSPPLPPTLLSADDTPAMPIKSEEPRDKKPRIRHSEIQLAALNELYEANEHPSLEERADLAERLNMEPKAVNAWFANKRSATKKKSRGSIPPYSTPPPHAHAEDDEEDQLDNSRLSTPLGSMDYPSFPNTDSDNRHVFDSEISSSGVPRRMRIRPTPKQTEELRKLYTQNTHPSREERQALGDRIGMKYQSVTNWFQNQRSLARKRLEEQELEVQSAHSTDHNDDTLPLAPRPESRTFNSFPPATHHPSLGPSMPARRSPAPVRSFSDSHVPVPDFKSSPLRRQSNGPLSRPRRTRPEPHQLDALKKLFARTPNPSIEERGALALEIGMDVGKVTNWFRNLRQTARKRAQKSNNDEGDDEGMDYDESAPASRIGTPMFPSTSYSSSATSVDGDVDRMDLDGEHEPERPELHHHHSDGSEEEDQEAVTPPPAAPRAPVRRRMDVGFLTGSSDELPLSSPAIKPFSSSAVPPAVPRPRVEDAMLLLSFSQHIAQW